LSFLSHHTTTPEIYTLSLHDALPILERCMGHVRLCKDAQRLKNMQLSKLGELSAMSSVEKPILAPEQVAGVQHMWAQDNIENFRSEEHTSELQSRENLVCRLLLEKKK